MRSAEQLYDLMMGHRLASLVLLVVATVAVVHRCSLYLVVQQHRAPLRILVL